MNYPVHQTFSNPYEAAILRIELSKKKSMVSRYLVKKRKGTSAECVFIDGRQLYTYGDSTDCNKIINKGGNNTKGSVVFEKSRF